jgi:thiol:disulfide interchange protein DsbD
VSCKVNEHTVLESDAVRSAMQKLDVVPLEADWTRQDPQISEWLTKYKRAGVPMYLVVPPSGIEGAILLPEVITPSMVTDALTQASGG